jgi:hypothetical protein
MPNLYAALVASIVGWIFDDLVGSALALPLRLLAGLAVSAVAFYYAFRFFKGLRDDMR